MLDFAKCERLVSSARDGRSKPVQNNTRVERRDEDTYALRLHATDIATFHRDGRTTVSSGGWRTVTTMERLRGYVFRGQQLVSDHGVWSVLAEPDPNDPRPERGQRTVPKPFEALNPGRKPVKPAEGCLAGTETVVTEQREVLVHLRELREGEELSREGYTDSFGYVVRDVTTVTRYVETGDQTWSHRTDLPPFEHEGDKQYREVCPHCKLFNAQLEAWEQATFGGGWGRNRTHGYVKMIELLDDYGSREAWQEAYLADFRAAREQNRLRKEWEERNYVLFEDGMEITSEGYAKRPNLKAIASQKRRQRKIDRKRKRINQFVADAVNALVTNGLPMPSGGDCWGCCMRAVDDPSAEPLGVDHLEQHIEEGYYVPSMFVNALREHGYGDTGIYMMLCMDPENDRMGGPQEGYRSVSEDTITRDLRKYLYKRLITELSSGKTVVTF